MPFQIVDSGIYNVLKNNFQHNFSSCMSTTQVHAFFFSFVMSILLLLIVVDWWLKKKKKDKKITKTFSCLCTLVLICLISTRQF